MNRFKKLTKNRALTIPKDIAAEFGVIGGEAVVVSYHKGTITIKKRVPCCRLCDKTENAKTFTGLFHAIDICPDCAKRIKERFDYD